MGFDAHDHVVRREEDFVNPKKLKEKDRRRARKLADEAWEAVNNKNLDLAEKIIRRAVAAQIDNPILWNDQGMILSLRGNEAEAAEAFRSALSLAPTFAEPFAHLATLRARQGFLREAIAMQAQAVKHAPDSALYAEQLEVYRSLADDSRPTTVGAPQPTSEPVSFGQWPEKLEILDWASLAERLTHQGCVPIPKLVDPAICALFARHVRR